MIGDQPHSYFSTSMSSTSDKEVFKVQRSPDGNLSLVYNETHEVKGEKDSKANHIHGKQIRGCKY